MRALRERERRRDRLIGLVPARVRHVHGAARRAVDGQDDLAAGGDRGEAEVRGVGTGRGDRDRVLGPLAGADVGDVRDAVDEPNVDGLGQPAGGADVLGRGVAVRDARAAVVIVLDLNPAGDGMGAVVRGLAR